MNPQQLELESDRALYCYQMLFTFAFTFDCICTLASPNPVCGRNVLKFKVVFDYRKLSRKEKKLKENNFLKVGYLIKNCKENQKSIKVFQKLIYS